MRSTCCAAKVDQSAVHWEESISHVESSRPDTQESAELSLRRERIQAALAQLPPEQKQALILAYFGGYTESQIAELLSQSLGTITTRLRLPMRKLREFLSQEPADQDKSVSPQSVYDINKEEGPGFSMSDLPHDTHILDLLPAYATGSLDADELQDVEQHLVSCWICRNELSAFQTIADELRFARVLQFHRLI